MYDETEFDTLDHEEIEITPPSPECAAEEHIVDDGVGDWEYGHDGEIWDNGEKADNFQDMEMFDNPHDDARVRFELGGMVGDDEGAANVITDDTRKVRTHPLDPRI